MRDLFALSVAFAGGIPRIAPSLASDSASLRLAMLMDTTDLALAHRAAHSSRLNTGFRAWSNLLSPFFCGMLRILEVSRLMPCFFAGSACNVLDVHMLCYRSSSNLVTKNFSTAGVNFHRSSPEFSQVKTIWTSFLSNLLYIFTDVLIAGLSPFKLATRFRISAQVKPCTSHNTTIFCSSTKFKLLE